MKKVMLMLIMLVLVGCSEPPAEKIACPDCVSLMAHVHELAGACDRKSAEIRMLKDERLKGVKENE